MKGQTGMVFVVCMQVLRLVSAILVDKLSSGGKTRSRVANISDYILDQFGLIACRHPHSSGAAHTSTSAACNARRLMRTGFHHHYVTNDDTHTRMYIT